MRSLDPVVIWGAGAMGGSIGAWLSRAGHEVLFVDADSAHVEAIRTEGLRITGPIDEFTVQAPCLSPDEVEPGLRTVLLCVKAHHTEAAVPYQMSSPEVVELRAYCPDLNTCCSGCSRA